MQTSPRSDDAARAERNFNYFEAPPWNAERTTTIGELESCCPWACMVQVSCSDFEHCTRCNCVSVIGMDLIGSMHTAGEVSPCLMGGSAMHRDTGNTSSRLLPLCENVLSVGARRDVNLAVATPHAGRYAGS